MAVLPDANAQMIQVRPCPDPKFGDYQSAALISLAKERKLAMRTAALSLGVQKVAKEKMRRGLYP